MATTILPQNLNQREIMQQDDLLIGPLLAPTNSAKHLGAGSIHDDATAKKLGFRGGTVAGSLHMEQFPPMATRVFGESWWQTGGLSLYFRYATADLESVRCFSKAGPEQNRTNVWMEDAEDHLVAEGTINIKGWDPESPLRLRIKETPAPTDLRILEHVRVGASSGPVATRVEQAVVAQRLAVITEPMAVYEQSPAVIPPSLIVRIMRPAESAILPRHKNIGVGLFGAIETQHLAGPVFADTDYTCNATVLALGETPKTEYLWYETVLTSVDGRDVAGMLMMLRFMKASSSLWQA